MMTFEEWFKKQYPLHRPDKDTTHYHVMRRAWNASRNAAIDLCIETIGPSSAPALLALKDTRGESA